MNIIASIKHQAIKLGFDVVGVTGAGPPPHVRWFREWLDRGFHGEMDYLARRAAERANPQRVLPGAKSVIVAGMNCHVATAGDREQRPPRLARYAWGARDYHKVLADKLGLLAAFVRGTGAAARWYVDTGPILERDFAQRAGVGFIGKHTNLVSRRFGNWLVLGVVLTDLELPADQPERAYCGTCRRCLEACPTGALVAPYQLDARRCISYLTIELKGSIPIALRPLIGDRVFGCDDCLEVCPWNRFARQSPVRDFQRRALPALVEYLSWDEPAFRGFFRGTPIERIKRRGFLRNICVALGNLGGLAARQAVEVAAAHDHDPLVREHAQWAVQQICAKQDRRTARRIAGKGNRISDGAGDGAWS